jgi:hypothetical protein
VPVSDSDPRLKTMLIVQVYAFLQHSCFCLPETYACWRVSREKFFSFTLSEIHSVKLGTSKASNRRADAAGLGSRQDELLGGCIPSACGLCYSCPSRPPQAVATYAELVLPVKPAWAETANDVDSNGASPSPSHPPFTIISSPVIVPVRQRRSSHLAVRAEQAGSHLVYSYTDAPRISEITPPPRHCFQLRPLFRVSIKTKEQTLILEIGTFCRFLTVSFVVLVVRTSFLSKFRIYAVLYSLFACLRLCQLYVYAFTLIEILFKSRFTFSFTIFECQEPPV